MLLTLTLQELPEPGYEHTSIIVTMLDRLTKLSDEAAEYGEPLLDHFSSSLIQPLAGSLSDVVKEEPILKIALGVIKLPRSISDAMFVHKFNKLFEGGDLTREDVASLKKKLTGNKKVRFWKLIFTSIQSHDDEKRSELVGKVVKALADGLLSYEDSIIMIHASNRVNVENLRYLLQCYLGNPRTMPGYARQEFVTLGLLGIDESKVGTWDGGSTLYPLTDFGARYTGAIYDHPTYSYRTDLKLGIEPLVGCQRNLSDNSREVLPLKEVIDKGYWYGEAASVVWEHDKILLFNQSPVLYAAPILAGEYGEKRLSSLAGIEEEAFIPVLVRRDEHRHVSVHYYILAKEHAKKLITDTSASWHSLGELIRSGHSDELKDLPEAIIKYNASQEEQKIKLSRGIK